MSATFLEILAAILFALAVLHTFSAGAIHRFAGRFREGSVAENTFQFLGEVEAVFGIWAAILFLFMTFFEGFDGAVHYLESQNFTEAVFVFVVMCVAATRPIIILAEKSIAALGNLLPLPGRMGFFLAALIVGPLLGSLITEPAAMTVTAMILADYFYKQKMSEKFKYATLGLLFVNVSIGGTLTHFAAPPVLMVAGKFGWDTSFMMAHFGWKSASAIAISTVATAFFFRKELGGGGQIKTTLAAPLAPQWWLYVIHVLFLALIVVSSHHMSFFVGVFLFFLGFTAATKEYQSELKLRESLMVGFFLAGLVVLGTMQKWWLQPFISQLSDYLLYFGATFMTAITDNAALTYLGSLVELSDSAKYFLVAGAVTGGGLTVIANAPNPAGYGILKNCFKDGTISPLGLLLGALFPTLVAILCLLLLPSL